MLQSIFVGIIVIVALVYSAHCIYKVLKHAGSSCYNCPIKDACNNRNKEKKAPKCNSKSIKTSEKHCFEQKSR